MISIITPAYNTPPDVLARTWASLKAQTYTDWEWVIWDDSTSPETWAQVYGFASDERYRIKLFRSHVHSGSIGEVKRNGFMVAEGDILVELDHDDELTPDALELIAKAFEDNTIGFVFSDWVEILPDGQSGVYPDGWAFGYGQHYWDEELGVWGSRVSDINATTLGHIVSAPNHVRAWRASVYRELGGHNPKLDIADDYELVVRTALVTEFAHIPKVIYKQHVGGHTAQRQKNDRIQELVSQISNEYGLKLQARYSLPDMSRDIPSK
jgi:glycosyltransferase involved in cell wall biosynthesis